MTTDYCDVTSPYALHRFKCVYRRGVSRQDGVHAKRKGVCTLTVYLVVFGRPAVTLVSCGQTVRWIKMPLGTEVGLGPGDIVLDGDPAPPRKGTQQPATFWPMSIVAKRSPS